MIFDSHCHVLPPDFGSRHNELAARDATYAALFPESGGRFADAEQLLRDMDAAGVDRAVAMGFGWTDPDVATEVNNYLIRAAAAHSERITAFASVNPAWGDQAVREASRCLDAGAYGIGEIHAHSQRFDIGDAALMGPLMALLRTRNAPIVIHASEPVGHQYPGKGSTTPPGLLQFAADFPENRIVFAHLGGGLPFYAAMPEVADALSNVWYDTAALPFLYRPSAIVAAAMTAGPDRILFGTDYPLLTHRRVIDYVQSAGLSQCDLDAIMGGNASFLVNAGNPPMETLPDYLRPGLDIVLIGLNPSIRSVQAGRYFANPRNRFWTAVSAANLVGRPVGSDDDAALLADGIGFTDVVKRPTSQASGLTAADYRRDAPALREKLLRHAPRIACFHGFTAYRAYLRHGEGIKTVGSLELGRQDLVIGSSRVFVLPNPSPANARYSLDDLSAWYRELNRWRIELTP
ncbi:MAG: amidohydrolase family protein [Chloroflexota bacterium]|nr:amidohydrolase family protein [Chloroflexota bacterium]MDE2961665.1 amidohydrolase family protein [Chloroflexota bacterium]